MLIGKLFLISPFLSSEKFTYVCWIPCVYADGADLAQNLSRVCFHGNGAGAADGHVTFLNTLITHFHCQILDDCDDVDVCNHHIFTVDNIYSHILRAHLNMYQ